MPPVNRMPNREMVLEVADTVQVMRRGRTVRRWENRDLTAQQVLSCCYEDEEAET